MAALLLCIISAALSAWESRSLGRHLSRPTLSRLPRTASQATWSKVARRQTDSNFPLVDLLVVIAIYGNDSVPCADTREIATEHPWRPRSHLQPDQEASQDGIFRCI